MIEAVLIGLAAGVGAGLLGDAEATSLLAIIPVALVGAWRQNANGNVELRTGLMLGVLAAAGATGGVLLANALPQRVLEVGFALLILGVAAQLVRRALRDEPRAAT